MNSHDLEAFAAVVETGSIVGASKRLHLTQPGISRWRISRNGPTRFPLIGPTLHGLPAEPQARSFTRPFCAKQVSLL